MVFSTSPASGHGSLKVWPMNCLDPNCILRTCEFQVASSTLRPHLCNPRPILSIANNDDSSYVSELSNTQPNNCQKRHYDNSFIVLSYNTGCHSFDKSALSRSKTSLPYFCCAGLLFVNNIFFIEDGVYLHSSTESDLLLFIFFRVSEGNQKENLGIMVQYKVKIKLFLGSLGG